MGVEDDLDTGATTILGIDVGGTFTDVFCQAGGRVAVVKTPSTPGSPGHDVVEGIRLAAAELGLGGERALLRRTSIVFHGSTVATNALLTHSGATVGLITTRGFRDILEMRGGVRESAFDPHQPRGPQICPRHLRHEVSESTKRSGAVLETPPAEELTSVITALRQAGADAVAICFKHSWSNDETESAAEAFIEDRWPEAFLTRSTAVANRARLYDRTSTSVVNSYVGPNTVHYAESLGRMLGDLGFRGRLLIMASNGGVVALPDARRSPVSLLLSGPSAGPQAAHLALRALSRPARAIVVDMGGTSFDVSVLQDARVEISATRDIGGYRVATPMLDIETVGAGGGSIAWLDDLGLLQVGPRSAGALPGPACYGLGGTEPTVTDANLLLGLLPPDAILGGARSLDVRHAGTAVTEHIAKPLGVDLVEAARGIHRVATAFMTAAVRDMTVGKGLDPRSLPLVLAGGAGGLHGAKIASGLGITEVIVPRHAGVFCAVGMAFSEVRYARDISIVRAVHAIDRDLLGSRLAAAKWSVLEQLEEIGHDLEGSRLEIMAEARYVGQFHELAIGATEQDLLEPSFSGLVARFHDAHLAAYGFCIDTGEVELVNVRVTAIGLVARHLGDGADPVSWGFIETGQRPLRLDSDPVLGTIWELIPDSNAEGVDGPGVIELPTSTVHVPLGWSCRVWPTGDISLLELPLTQVGLSRTTRGPQ